MTSVDTILYHEVQGTYNCAMRTSPARNPLSPMLEPDGKGIRRMSFFQLVSFGYGVQITRNCRTRQKHGKYCVHPRASISTMMLSDTEQEVCKEGPKVNPITRRRLPRAGVS